VSSEHKAARDEKRQRSLVGKFIELLDHFFSAIGKHQPGCAIENPETPKAYHHAPTGAPSSDRSGVAE